MRLAPFICVIILILPVSCNNTSEKNIKLHKPGKNDIEEINRYLVQKDRERIQNYADRKNLKIKESPTGLWYCIKKEGTGNFFTDNDKISIDYICSLLDGTECYNSAELGPKDLIIGKSELEAGLNEGLRLLKPGGEAVFILPPFLAFGLVGDGKLIPSRAVLVYEIRIREVK
jgi:FKBP-type peptidyl-prolyl cis-trans isomerase FkpA